MDKQPTMTRVAPLQPDKLPTEAESNIGLGDYTTRQRDQVSQEGQQHPPGVLARLGQWHRQLNLPRLNEIFAIVYLAVGAFIMLVTVAAHPQNNMRGTSSSCHAGYCYVRHMTNDPKRPAYRHVDKDAFHPYDWSPFLTSILLVADGVLILIKATLIVVNLGHFMNFIVCFFCLYTCVRSFTHIEHPMHLHFESPAWAEGIVHTFFAPFFMLAITIVTMIQAGLNATTLTVVGINHYPELALSFAEPPPFYDAETGRLKKKKEDSSDDDDESTLELHH